MDEECAPYRTQSAVGLEDAFPPHLTNAAYVIGKETFAG